MPLSPSRIYFRQLGQNIDEFPAVVLLHGLFGMSDNLMRLGKTLAEDYTVYLPDLRNHGRSLHSDEMSWTAMVADIIDLLNYLQRDKVILLGHSLGGKVAMSLASQYPHKVPALIVADIAPVSYPERHQAVFKALKAVDLSAINQRKDAADIMAEYVSDAGVIQFLLKSLYKNSDAVYQWRFNLDALIANYATLSSAPDLVAPYQGPALFIKGERSDYITAQHQAVTQAMFPHFQFKMIQGAGHWLHAEKPVAFARLVQNFLRSSLG
jgi:esterase